MKLKVGDKVTVIAGKDKGKSGKIIKTLRNEDKVIVEGVNIIKNTLNLTGKHLAQLSKQKLQFMFLMLW